MKQLKQICVILFLSLTAPIVYSDPTGWIEVVNYCVKQPSLAINIESFTSTNADDDCQRAHFWASPPVVSNSSVQFDQLNAKCRYWKLYYGSEYYVVPINTTAIINNGFKANECVCVSESCIAAAQVEQSR